MPLRERQRPFKKATKKTDLLTLLKKRALKPGTVLEIEVSAPMRVAKAVRLTIRKAAKPSTATLCRTPGAALGRCAT